MKCGAGQGRRASNRPHVRKLAQAPCSRLDSSHPVAASCPTHAPSTANPSPQMQRLPLHLVLQGRRSRLQLVPLPLQLEVQVQRRPLQPGIWFAPC